jgi:hypothetical protein
MLRFLGINKYVMIGGGIIIALLLGAVAVKHIQLQETRAELQHTVFQRDEAARIAKANALALDIYKADQIKIVAGLQDKANRAAARAPKVRVIYREIDRAHNRPGEDGPAAPVLKRAADQLRALHAAHRDKGDQGRAAGQPAPVPRGAARPGD